MPIMFCETAQRLDNPKRTALAKSITQAVHEVIGSDLNLISVVFHELEQDQIWLAGQTSQDALILCYIRGGASDGAQDGVGATRFGRLA
jgi:phenylpyruvate tautomerase PptA (4-oxalocrotonate tautomerase family)